MRQASAELFPTNEPIPASQMIGREQDVRRAHQPARERAAPVAGGAEAHGQDERLRRGAHALPGRRALHRKVDLFRVGDAAELAETLAVQVIRNRSAAHRLVRATRKAGRAALSAAQATAVLKLGQELGEGVEIALSPGLAAEEPQKALDAALRLPEAVAKADRKRLVLFFDEFQEVAADRKPYGDPDARDQAHASHLPAHLERQLPVRRQRRARDAGPVRPERPGLQRLRRVLRARGDRRGCVEEGPGRALRRGRLPDRATRPSVA